MVVGVGFCLIYWLVACLLELGKTNGYPWFTLWPVFLSRLVVLHVFVAVFHSLSDISCGMAHDGFNCCMGDKCV